MRGCWGAAEEDSSNNKRVSRRHILQQADRQNMSDDQCDLANQ